MKFLLDTHVFLWFIGGNVKLPAAWRDTIRQPHHEVYLSVVSLWEAMIKYHLGKLPLPEPQCPGVEAAHSSVARL